MTVSSVRLLVVLVLVASPASPGSAPASESCDIVSSRHPQLKAIFAGAADLRRSAQTGASSFTALVERAGDLRALAERSLTTIQEAGCPLEGEPAREFSTCLAPLLWGCEAVPPAIDWAFLSEVHKTREEALAFSITHFRSERVSRSGVDVLSGKRNVFDTCCGDFGCAQGGVGIPPLFHDPDGIGQLVALASREGKFGDAALDMLEASSQALLKATCVCEGERPGPEETKAVAASLEAGEGKVHATGERGRRIRDAVGTMAAAIRRGLPNQECREPGY